MQLVGRVAREGQNASVHFVMVRKQDHSGPSTTPAEHEFSKLLQTSCSGDELYTSCLQLVHSDTRKVHQQGTITMPQFRDFLNSFLVCLIELGSSNGCHLCMLTDDDASQHVIPTCGWVKNCCVLCFEMGHGSARCPNSRIIVPQMFCSECLLPLASVFGLHNSKWGLKCDGAGRYAFKRFVFGMVPRIMRSKSQTSLQLALDSVLPKSLVRDYQNSYRLWLFDRTERLPNVLRIIHCAFATNFT